MGLTGKANKSGYQVTPDGQELFLNGNSVGTGPARKVFGIEGLNIGKARNTVIHTGKRIGWVGGDSPHGFVGRLADFRLLHRAAPPQ